MLCVIATSTYYIHTTVNYKTTTPPLRMFACVKKNQLMKKKKKCYHFCVSIFVMSSKKQLLSHIIYLFFVSAIFRMRNKNISIIVVTKSFLFFSTWYEEKLEQNLQIFFSYVFTLKFWLEQMIYLIIIYTILVKNSM